MILLLLYIHIHVKRDVHFLYKSFTNFTANDVISASDKMKNENGVENSFMS